MRAIRQRLLLLQSRTPPPCARAHALTHTLTPSLAPFSLPSLLSTPLRVSGLLTVRVADRYVGEFCTAHSTQHTVHRPQHTAHNSLALSPPLYLSSLSLPHPLSPHPLSLPLPLSRPLLPPFPSLHTAKGEWAADCASCQQLCGEFNVRAIRQRLLLQSRMPPPLRARTRTHAHTDPLFHPLLLPLPFVHTTEGEWAADRASC